MLNTGRQQNQINHLNEQWETLHFVFLLLIELTVSVGVLCCYWWNVLRSVFTVSIIFILFFALLRGFPAPILPQIWMPTPHQATVTLFLWQWCMFIYFWLFCSPNKAQIIHKSSKSSVNVQMWRCENVDFNVALF